MDAVAGALADPTRREILLLLRDQRCTAGDIAARFPLSRPAISRHLRVLREAGLVRDELHGREREYHLIESALEPLEQFLRALRERSTWERRFAALETEVHRVKRRVKAPTTQPVRKKAIV